MLDDNDELSEDEEEILVYVEFDGSVAGNTFGNEKLTLDMIGLDKEHPIMQVNGKYYEGTYQDAVGTYMFFEKDKNPPVDDPVFDAKPTLKYCAKTRKILKMQRIFVEPKTEMFGDSNDQNCIPNMKIISEAGIPPKYQEAALKSWESMRNDRMEALNKYLEKQRIREEKRSRGIEPDSESDDDNPFVMYKPEARPKKTKEIANDSGASSEKSSNSALDRDSASRETTEKDSRSIDPGASTSKDRQLGSGSSAKESSERPTAARVDDDACRASLSHFAGENRATVKIMRKGKTRKNPRATSKKKSDEESRKSDDSEDADDLSPMDESDRPLDDSFANDTADSLEIANDETSENEKLTASTDAGEESETTSDKRKIEKQQKRDEKMRLISERLKKAAEELRLKTNRPSEN